MRYLSLFSGIEAASVAWGPLGWECVGVSEIEPVPCALLAERYPNVPNIGDVTKVTEEDIFPYEPCVLRFITPVECERLQGFPDGYTLLTNGKKPTADGNRYKALGNSMAVPAMAWIGRQIDIAELFQ